VLVPRGYGLVPEGGISVESIGFVLFLVQARKFSVTVSNSFDIYPYILKNES
jgi:hypothetical protein